MRFGVVFAVLQAAWSFRSQPARFHHGKHFQLHHLSDALQAMDRRFLPRPVLQPAASVGMVLMDQNEGMQPSLLAARAKKQGQIKGRSKAIVNDVRWEADLLPGILKVRRRGQIASSDFGDGPVDRRDLLPRPLAALVLIPIELRPPRLLTEKFRGARKYFRYGWVVRQNKCRQ